MLDELPIIPLFDDLSAEQTALLAAMFEMFHCPTGTAIFEQGDPAEYLYLILKGRVAIRYKPYDAPHIVLTRLKGGDVFGWSAAIGSKKYTSGAVSQSDIEALRLHRDSLHRLLDEHPELGKIMLDRLALNVSPRWKNAYEQIQPLIASERKSS